MGLHIEWSVGNSRLTVGRGQVTLLPASKQLIGHSQGDCTEGVFQKCPGGLCGQLQNPSRVFFLAHWALTLGLGHAVVDSHGSTLACVFVPFNDIPGILQSQLPSSLCCIAASLARSDDRTYTQHVSSSHTPGGANKFKEKGVLHSNELTLCSSIFIEIFWGSE
jgi:hypothetical protein